MAHEAVHKDIFDHDLACLPSDVLVSQIHMKTASYPLRLAHKGTETSGHLHMHLSKLLLDSGKETDRFGIEVPDKYSVVLRAADDERLAWVRHEGRKQAMRIIFVPCTPTGEEGEEGHFQPAT